MKKQFFILANLLFVLVIFCFADNQTFADTLPAITAIPTPGRANTPVLTPTPPNVNAEAYILIDVNSGNVIAEKNADAKREPASLTKLMTMYVVSGAIEQGQISLNDDVRISTKAWQTGGSRMFVKVGDRVAVKDLLQGIIVDSGNDACVAMAEHVAGNESSFADLMNQTAKSLGMTGTHFVDSTGLPDPNHYTTARDLAVLARAVILNYPEDYKWYKEKWFTYNGIKQPNRNRLLWRDPTVDGLKTGHTEEAGYCQVSSAVQNNTRLLAVILGAPTDEARADDSQRLLTYGFRFFETHKLYKAAQNISQPRVWKGSQETVPVGLAHDLYVTIPTGQYKNLKPQISLPNGIEAPIQKGQAIGDLTVTLADKVVAKQPLVALADDAKGGFWTRMRDSLSLTVQGWFGSKTEKS